MKQTPAQVAQWLRSMQRNLPVAIRQVERESAVEALQTMVIQFSGAVSSSQLAGALNSPYGRGSSNARGLRGPIPYGDPSIVNAQTGQARDSWSLKRTSNGWLISSSDEVVALLNSGTSKMIARPFRDRVLQIVLPQRLQRVRRVIDRIAA